MKKCLLAAAMVSTALSSAMAADLPVKAHSSQPYDLTHCGWYAGVNTIGTAGSVQGPSVAPGTQVVQGGIGATAGYGCPISVTNGSFWFAEVQADVMNLNGNVNGLSLSGPAAFTERFGIGSPLNSMLGMILPAGTANPAVPSLPLLPAGITASPGAPYAYVALHQTDISVSNGLARNSEWALSVAPGLGLRYRLSNGVVADVYAEYAIATDNSICVGPLPGACAKIGNRAQVGFQLLY